MLLMIVNGELQSRAGGEVEDELAWWMALVVSESWQMKFLCLAWILKLSPATLLSKHKKTSIFCCSHFHDWLAVVKYFQGP